MVYLHGFSLTDPEPYQPHIDHLTRQGFIVVYPQFNLTGLGIFGDNDQNVMLSRAIGATQVALGALGGQAGPLHLFGHSLGGLLVQVNWTPPAQDGGRPVTGYRVLRDNATVATVGAVARTFTDTPVDCGRHEYRVAAANSVGEGPPSAVAVAVVPCRPDAEIAAGRTSAFVGDGVYLDAPARAQLAVAPVRKRATVVFPVRVGNDGEVADSFRVGANLSGAPSGFGVGITHAGQDVTADVRAGTYVIDDLAAGDAVTLKVKVTAYGRSTWAPAARST